MLYTENFKCDVLSVCGDVVTDYFFAELIYFRFNFYERVTPYRTLRFNQRAMMDIADVAVLCVDDEIEIINALKSCLRREPYMKLFAVSGEEALALLEESHCNARVIVIVSDFRMPGMSGIELVERVKSRFPDIVCILISGNNNIHQLVEAGQTVNMFSTITKPIDAAAFKKTLNDAIEYYCNTLKQ